jgi:hypothetical protein
LPEPFGPTTQVMPGSRRRVVADANDLKPRSVRLFRYTAAAYRAAQAWLRDRKRDAPSRVASLYWSLLVGLLVGVRLAVDVLLLGY